MKAKWAMLMVVVVMLGMVLSAVRADDGKGESEFTSKDGKAAQAAYKEDLRKAEEAYVAKALEAKKKYYQSLSSAYIQALKDKEKDEAQRLLATRTALKDEIAKAEDNLKLLKVGDSAETAETKRLAQLKAERQEKMDRMFSPVGKWVNSKNENECLIGYTNGTLWSGRTGTTYKWQKVGDRLYHFNFVKGGGTGTMSRDGKKMLLRGKSSPTEIWNRVDCKPRERVGDEK